MKTDTHPNLVYSETYDPAFEAIRLASMFPRARHEEMLERHKQAKATRRENHRRGLHRMRFPIGVLR